MAPSMFPSIRHAELSLATNSDVEVEYPTRPGSREVLKVTLDELTPPTDRPVVGW